MGRPLEEAEVRELRAAFKQMSSATVSSVEPRDAIGDCRQYGSEGVALCDSWLAQGRVIEAARAYVEADSGDTPRTYNELRDAVLASGGETETPPEQKS